MSKIDKTINFINLSIRAGLFLFLPGYFLINLAFQGLFNSTLPMTLATSISYLALCVKLLHDNYKQIDQYISLSNRENLDNYIRNGEWEEFDRHDNTLVVRPRFDSPFRFMINDKVSISYNEMRIKLTGPLKYVDEIDESVTGSKDETKSVWPSMVWKVIVFLFISLPFLRESRLMFNINILRHNVSADNNEAEVVEHAGAGSMPQNINNQGVAVEHGEDIFYIHNYQSLIRTSQDLEFERLLNASEESVTLSDLNIAGDWLYYTAGQEIRRVRLDGSDQETLYDIGYAMNLNVMNDRLYFIDYSGNHNLFSMTLNGQDLKRIADIEAMDLTVYEDELLVSTFDQVMRFSLDGSESETIIEEYASSLLRFNDHYYYIDSEGYLTKQSVHSSTRRVRTRVLERPVDRYTLTDDALIYVQDSHVYSNVDRGLFISDHDGGTKTRIHPYGNIHNLTIIEDHLLFTLVNDYSDNTIMSYNLTSGELNELYD
ncbi:DUF5050 domain-containing protein [Alkalibacterium pelagium]|uniref:Prolow-density lipoprotein receptor-related protein 1-like beta-propeller domain-containing protein n=1 Tax=Alkalibacterium pelagium TaxID=426702 RepID=A0A1H7JXU2_9LACT|nr:DUF5050 domain-containing protein [Alkalibacterium pelagium]GEN50510.1 hypothetical protein APE02nite_11750 [Alkalibacterium pelagium]SEK79369.1 protein of unknown function [Alkalibacterium pelagium]